MKQLLAFIFSIFLVKANGQVAISNPASNPDPSAMLDVKSTTKGFLMPRVVLRTDVVSPATGLLVYETTTNALWVYNGTAWVQLGSGGGSSQWLVNGTHIYSGNTGNVGIGTSTPSSKFHVFGNMLMDGNNPTLQFQNAGVDKGFVQLSGDNFRIGTNSSNGSGKTIIRTNGADQVFIDSIGQVGIGKSTPQFDLDVYGNARIQTTSAFKRSTLSLYANPNYINDPYGPASVTFLNWSDAGGGNYNYAAKFRVEMDGGVAERLKLSHVDFDNQLVLNKNGNVGINNAFPAEKLEVTGNVQIENVNPLLKLRRTSVAAIGDFGIEFNSSSNTNLANIAYSDGKLKLTHGSVSTNDIVIDGANVGLGTETPQERLHVNGNLQLSWVDPFIKLQRIGVDKGFIDLSDNDFRFGTYSSNTTGSVRMRVNGLERMNVSPDGTMNLINGQDAGLASTTNGYLMLGSFTGSNIVIDNNEIIARGSNGVAGNLVLQNDGGTVRIGNVSVPSGYKFAINGKMLCEELRVKLAGNWPDYVFTENHKLLPLSDLKSFVQQNKHLPNIPAAATIEKEGMEVGDMQKRMMEKIEELTLYILQLEERNSKLGLRVDEMEKKLAVKKMR